MFKFICLLACLLHGGWGISVSGYDHSLGEFSFMNEEFFSIRVPKNAKVLVKDDSPFSCVGKRFGFYPDTRSQCKIVHVCHPSMTLNGAFTKFSFYCGGDTAFDQRTQSCSQIDIGFPCYGLPSLLEFPSEFSKSYLQVMKPITDVWKNLFNVLQSTRQVQTTPKPPVEVTTKKMVEQNFLQNVFSSTNFLSPSEGFENNWISKLLKPKPTESPINRRVDVTSPPADEEGSGTEGELSTSIAEDESIEVSTMSPLLVFPTETVADAGGEEGVGGQMDVGGEVNAGSAIGLEAGGDFKNYYRGEMNMNGSIENIMSAAGYSGSAAGRKKTYSKREVGVNADEELIETIESYVARKEEDEVMHSAGEIPGDDGDELTMTTAGYVEKNEEGEITYSATEISVSSDENTSSEASSEMRMDEGEEVVDEEQGEAVDDDERKLSMILEEEPLISEDQLELREEKPAQPPLLKYLKKRSLPSDSEMEDMTESHDFSETTTFMPGDIYQDGMLVQHDAWRTKPVYAPVSEDSVEKYSRMDDNSDEDDSDEEFFTTPAAI